MAVYNLSGAIFSMTIYLKDLVVTQNKLRHRTKAIQVTDLTKPIVLTRTEDGVLYIHDGHHRLFGLWKSGVRALDESYFKIKDYTYMQLMDINLEVGWVTPIDFRTHCRRPDLSEYKEYVLSLDKETLLDVLLIKKRIAELEPWYKAKRKITRIEEFTDL